MKRQKHYLFFLLILTLGACIEGPELEQDPFNDVPDGRFPVILQHANERYLWVQSGLDSAQYAQYLLDKFGPTRSILIRERFDGQEIAELEVPTVSSYLEGPCNLLDGALIELYEGSYQIVENEEGQWPFPMGYFDVYDNGEPCIVIQFEAE